MKLAVVTHPELRSARPAIIDGSEVITTTGQAAPEFDRVLKRTLDGESLSPREILEGDERTLTTVAAETVSLEAPIAPGGRVFCMGGAYTSHLRERDRSLFTVPHQWLVPDTAVTGTETDIVLPESVSETVMPAIELAIVIGNGGSYIDEADALDHVAGYTISNDVTARTDWPGPRGYKLFDTFSPCGPYVVTADEISDPLDLEMELRQDGDSICTGTTAGHRFTLSFLVSYLSTIHELRPGDVISTGDPGGVAEPLRTGARIEAEIEDIGVLENTVVAED